MRLILPQTPALATASSQAVAVGIYLLLGLIIALLARPAARLLLRLGRLGPAGWRPTAERLRTLEGLIASLISVVAVVLAVVASLSRFVSSETLIWIIGLFSAAFGLGARSVVADILAGSGYILHDTFAIGEKVELYMGVTHVEGIVEAVNVRNTLVRAPTGELFTVPNGEIIVVRNFTRSPLSAAKIKLNVPSMDLARTLALLEALGREAVDLLPELREPWQIISTADTMGACTEVTVLATSAFGQAATLRLRLIALIYGRLAAAGITLQAC